MKKRPVFNRFAMFDKVTNKQIGKPFKYNTIALIDYLAVNPAVEVRPLPCPVQPSLFGQDFRCYRGSRSFVRASVLVWGAK